MMWSKIRSSLLTDLDVVLHDKTLLVRILLLFIPLIILKCIFPLFSGITFSKTGLHPYNYYSLVAITLVALIPTLIGELYVRIIKKESNLHIFHIQGLTKKERSTFLLFRMIIPAFFSLVFVILTIILAKPVPTEGWLRTFYAAGLLSIQSPFVFLFIIALKEIKFAQLKLIRPEWIFLIVAPPGLLLHHPWNYLAFFSPVYWIVWAWVVKSPIESMIYGLISVVLTFTMLVICFRSYIRNYHD